MVQALVEHYAALGQPDAVERCVLQMDIASLDFNQLVKLCRQHHLLSALAYILNRGLNDFVTPAAELLLGMLSVAEPPAPADPPAGDAGVHLREAAACKLLAYLRCCFRGEAFPPGACRTASSLEVCDRLFSKGPLWGSFLWLSSILMYTARAQTQGSCHGQTASGSSLRQAAEALGAEMNMRAVTSRKGCRKSRSAGPAASQEQQRQDIEQSSNSTFHSWSNIS